jgi:IS1 family transposase
MAYQDRVLVNLNCKRIEVDELWAFVGSKEKNIPAAKKGGGTMGDVWTWVSICAERKLVPAWYIGGRDSEAAMFFMDNLAKRLTHRVQLTSDGFKPYLDAVEGAFGTDIDYAMLVKIYGELGGKTPERKYSPAVCNGARKHRVEGKPDPKLVSTSYVERNNGIIRQHCKRYARLTQAFSKKLENHVYAFALHTMYHNFVKISGAHRMTPAQAAGVDSRLWEIGDIVKVVDEWETASAR